MIPVLTPRQMQEADTAAISSGTPGSVLMERAGAAVATRALKMMGGGYGRRVLVLAGKGNNGGDGLVVARRLHRAGAMVRVALLAPPTELHGDPLSMYESLVPLRISVGTPDAGLLAKVAAESDLIVDALFGTGFSGALTGEAARWVEVANASGVPTLAVDIPSGIDGRTGIAGGPAIRAERTVAIQAVKTGHLMNDGVVHSGEIEVADIKIPTDIADPAAQVPEPDDIATMIRWRPADAHKWSAGSLLVVGGSRGMSGAPLMTSVAALEAGAGIVTLAVPASVQSVVAEQRPEVMTVGLIETPSGGLDVAAFDEIAERASRFDALAIGPGMGADPSTRALVVRILLESEKPVILDADGLNLIGTDAVEIIGGRRAVTIITPHPGEMGRLLGVGASDIEADRLDVAASVASKWGCVVLLKGPRTLVAAPGLVPLANPTGGPELATAGAGDVLTGVVAGLLVSGTPAHAAAAAGAYVHGLAGKMAGEQTSGRGVTATSVAEAVPAAIAALAV